jgi:hypothetical protein
VSDDRLAMIKSNMAASGGRPPYVTNDNADWLVAKLEEWQQAAGAEANLADERGREVKRLRGLLGRLEWAGTELDANGVKQHACPACTGHEHYGHTPACWLAEACSLPRDV